jgi:hypothetical protein
MHKITSIYSKIDGKINDLAKKIIFDHKTLSKINLSLHQSHTQITNLPHRPSFLMTTFHSKSSPTYPTSLTLENFIQKFRIFTIKKTQSSLTAS